jgi:hypothetical protein
VRLDPVRDGALPLPPCPGKEGIGPPRCGGGGGRTPRRIMAGDARGGSDAPAVAATNVIGGAGQG